MGDVPDGRRMVVGDHCWHVGEGPARSGQVERNPLFLAGEEHHVVEATAGPGRVTADHGAARNEAQHSRPGDPAGMPSGAVAISEHVGSSRWDPPTSTRAASTATRG